MPEKPKEQIWTDTPDYLKIEEHGVTIDAPTPTRFAIDNPWEMISTPTQATQPNVPQAGVDLPHIPPPSHADND